MKYMLKTKSVGSGMMQLLNRFCIYHKLKSPVSHTYGLNDHIVFDRWLDKLGYIHKQYKKEGLGLEIAKHVDASDVGLCGYMVNCCETISDYLSFFTKYSKIWYNYTQKKVYFLEDEVVISWNQASYFNAGLYTQETIISEELQVAIIYQRILQIVGEGNPFFNRVEFGIPSPTDKLIYEKYFKCPITFNSKKTNLFISKDILNLKIVNSDKTLFNILTHYADIVLKEIPEASDFLQLVKIGILNSIVNGEPKIDEVADSLNLSVRTLQKKLSDSSTSFQDLLKEVRFFLAKKYLLENEKSILEIANLLG